MVSISLNNRVTEQTKNAAEMAIRIDKTNCFKQIAEIIQIFYVCVCEDKCEFSTTEARYHFLQSIILLSRAQR